MPNTMNYTLKADDKISPVLAKISSSFEHTQEVFTKTTDAILGNLNKITDSFEKFSKLVPEKNNGIRESYKNVSEAVSSSSDKIKESISKTVEETGKATKNYAKLKESIDKVTESIKKLTEGAKKSWKAIGADETNKAAKGTNKLAEVFKGLFKASPAEAMAEAAKKIFEIGTKAETTSVKFGNLLHNLDQGKKLANELQEYSQTSPLKNEKIDETASSLLKFHVSLKNIVPTIGMLSDISEGSGTELDTLTEMYGKIAKSGKATKEQLEELSDANIPVIDALKDKLHITSEQFDKLVESGISIGTINEVFQSMTSSGGTFFNATQNQAGTTAGKLAILQKKAEDMGDGVFKAFQPLLNVVLDLGTTLVSSLKPAIDTIFGAFQPFNKFLAEHKELISALAAMVLTLTIYYNGQAIAAGILSGVTTVLSVAQGILNAVMELNPIILIITLVAGLVAWFVHLIAKGDSVIEAFQEMWGVIKKIWDNISDFFSSLFGGSNDIAKAKDNAKEIGKGAGAAYKDGFNAQTKDLDLDGSIYSSLQKPEMKLPYNPETAAAGKLGANLPTAKPIPPSSSLGTNASSIANNGGSKSINITIQKMVGAEQIHTNVFKESLATIKDELIKMLHESINDTGRVAGAH